MKRGWPVSQRYSHTTAFKTTVASGSTDDGRVEGFGMEKAEDTVEVAETFTVLLSPRRNQVDAKSFLNKSTYFLYNRPTACFIQWKS